MINRAGWLFSAFLLLSGIFMNTCEKTKHIEYVRNNTISVIPLPMPAIVKSVKYNPVPTNINIDSVLKEHYAEVVQVREIKDDRLEAKFEDTVSQNRSIGGRLSYKILQPTQIITTTRRGGLYVGVLLGASKDSMTYAGPSLTYTTNGSMSFFGSYNFINNSFQFGVSKRLFGK